MNALTVLLVIASIGYAGDCLRYGQPVAIEGRLGTDDDGGYHQWIALSPSRATCVEGDPSGAVPKLQVFAPGSGAVLDRLERLLGYTVVVRGRLYPATTGYSIGVAEVGPVDEGGRAALSRPHLTVPIKEVGAYRIEIVAGERLIKQVRQTATGRLLRPFEAYAPHVMSGEDLMYLRCRQGYRLASSMIRPAPVDQCGLDVCGVEIGDRTHTVTIEMRCVRAAPDTRAVGRENPGER